ncbi:F-box domain-containing protein [Mycena indigotica]|uniref:F-box domain-containing protein n=1 Tax=Mycena indigotica TaxID=2126181 RepID=A0A8H6T7U2_9AGAR|nr:F-box domain-containing protein [Mycena indigotica]KAF7312653.1 F-box domain-containing protein [Mycena indigotica]
MSTLSVLRSLESLWITVLDPFSPACHVLSPPKTQVLMSFPDELLWEIFAHCMDPHMSTFSDDNHLWTMMKVCRRWRTVILNAPQFWRHISFSDWREDNQITFSKSAAVRRTKQQVMRSGEVPLTLNLMPISVLADSNEVLDVLFDAAPRLESAVLTFNNHLLERFNQHADSFTSLWKLGLALIDEPGDAEKEATKSFLDGLEMLTHLHLSNQVEIDWVATLVPVESLWNRLKVCELNECMVDDVLLILPYFPPGSRIALIQGKYMRGAPDSLVAVSHSNIHALSFDRCDDDYIARILDNVTAPSLKRLAVWYFETPPYKQIFDMLQRSSASLTHFAVRLLSVGLYRQRTAPVSDLTDLLEFFTSEHLRDLLDLDLILASRFAPASVQLVHALSLDSGKLGYSELRLGERLLPKLQSLALRGYDDEDPHWETRLMALAESREGVLKSIWLGETLPAPTKRTLQKLSSHGVEFVCSWDMGAW